jgi:MAP3K TRAFs-binding domain
MSKSGMSEPARDILEPTYRQDNSDPETAGILGSIYKRLFKKNQDNRLAILARATYQQNFSTTRNYYTGINAASMAIISGKGSEGRAIAKEVIGLLDESTDDFWEQATLGEAFLLTRDTAKASQHYLHARKLAGKEWGKLQSVYDQLLLLNYFISVSPDILKAFAPPGVIAFTGHMIDHPQRRNPRFPASIEKYVKEGISSAIRTTRASIGYSSLSCGSDIIFAETMSETGGEVHLFLPFNREDYIRESVRFAGEHWVERFEALEKKFPVTYVTREHYTGNDDLFSFQNRVILGTVVLRAAMNFTTPTLLTVLSNTDLRQKEGGTRDTLVIWPYKEHYINVNPDAFLENKIQDEKQSLRPQLLDTAGGHIFYLVAADLAGASSADRESFKTFISGLREHLLLKPEFEVSGEEFITAFPLPIGAMEMVRSIIGFRKSLGNSVIPRISLHTVPLNAAGVDPDELLAVRELHQITPAGIPSAYGWFAAATTVSSDWTMEFAGIVGVAHQQSNEVYSVEFKK